MDSRTSKRQEPGPDELTYEMWQEAPKEMRHLLWTTANKINGGQEIPTAWETAYSKLLVKKEGEENVMESLRPVCLMNTAMKVITGIWAFRLSRALESKNVLEPVQEGSRPEHSTRRQVARLLSCIQDAKRKGEKIVIAFLDFENYFNAISIDVLYVLLEKFGMAAVDIALLKNYYARARFEVVQGDGTTSASIPPKRGLRQGCSLSLILGGMVVNAMIRWLESLGGGYRHGCGEEYNTLLFVDDSTLAASDQACMQRLLNCVGAFSDWTGVKVNLRKSEISGYDFRQDRALVVKGLTIKGGSFTYLKPDEPFKYLGIRMSIKGGMHGEKKYIREQTMKMANKLAGHQYHPQQMHWVVKVAIEPIFRYSAALVDWTSKEIKEIEKVWLQAYKKAWRVKKSTPGVTFWASRQYAGLDIIPAKAIITQEIISLVQQCTALDDDLNKIMRYDIQRAVRDLGVDTLQAACEERRWDGGEWKTHAELAHRFLASASRSVTIQWERMITTSADEVQGQNPACMVGTGIMNLMPMKAAGREEPSTWGDVRRWLRKVSLDGITTIEEAREQEKGIQLPLSSPKAWTEEAQTLAKEICVAAGITLTERQNVGPWHNKKDERGMQQADVGEDLVGGTVQLRRGPTWMAGKVKGYDAATDQYEIILNDGEQAKWTLSQLKDRWCANVKE